MDLEARTSVQPKKNYQTIAQDTETDIAQRLRRVCTVAKSLARNYPYTSQHQSISSLLLENLVPLYTAALEADCEYEVKLIEKNGTIKIETTKKPHYIIAAKTLHHYAHAIFCANLAFMNGQDKKKFRTIAGFFEWKYYIYKSLVNEAFLNRDKPGIYAINELLAAKNDLLDIEPKIQRSIECLKEKYDKITEYKITSSS